MTDTYAETVAVIRDFGINAADITSIDLRDFGINAADITSIDFPPGFRHQRSRHHPDQPEQHPASDGQSTADRQGEIMTAVTWWLRPGVNYDHDNCDRITAWAAANGLDASDMPGNQAIVVDTEQRTMTVTLIVEHTQDGDVVLPPRDVDRLEVRRTVPLIEPPPDDLFRPCDACLRGVRHSHGLPEVPQVTAPSGLSYSEIDVAVAYEKLRDDVQRLRDCLATLVDALHTPAESRT